MNQRNHRLPETSRGVSSATVEPPTMCCASIQTGTLKRSTTHLLSKFQQLCLYWEPTYVWKPKRLSGPKDWFMSWPRMTPVKSSASGASPKTSSITSEYTPALRRRVDVGVQKMKSHLCADTPLTHCQDMKYHRSSVRSRSLTSSPRLTGIRRFFFSPPIIGRYATRANGRMLRVCPSMGSAHCLAHGM